MITGPLRRAIHESSPKYFNVPHPRQSRLQSPEKWRKARAESGAAPKRAWSSPAALWQRKTTIIAAFSVAGIAAHLVLRFAFDVLAVLNALRAAFPPKVIHDL